VSFKRTDRTAVPLGGNQRVGQGFSRALPGIAEQFEADLCEIRKVAFRMGVYSLCALRYNIFRGMHAMKALFVSHAIGAGIPRATLKIRSP